MRSKKYHTQGLSWPDKDLLQRAKARAKRLGFNLSFYINQLVREDLKRGGDVVFHDPESVPNLEALSAAEKKAAAAVKLKHSSKAGAA